MEKEMASHSSILAWEITRTEPGGIGSQKESDSQHTTERQRLAADGGQGHPRITGGTPGSQEAPLSWICTDLLQPEGP